MAYRRWTHNSSKSEFNITFNIPGTVAILHTTNAFGTGLDLLHVANYAVKEDIRLHIIYPTSRQAIAGYSCNPDGDLVALYPSTRTRISILSLSRRQEVYRIVPEELQMSAIVGLFFRPHDSDSLMTIHADGFAASWDLARFPPSTGCPRPAINTSWNRAILDAHGSTLMTCQIHERGCTYSRLKVTEHNANFAKICGMPGIPVTTTALAPDGNSAIVGRTWYSWQSGCRATARKLAVPDKSSVTCATIGHDSTTASLALALADGASLVSVYNSRGRGIRSWSPGPGTRIWAGSFSEDGEMLGVGRDRGRSDGSTRYSVSILRLDNDVLSEFTTTTEWTSVKPMALAFGLGKMVVLGKNCGDLESLSGSSFSVLVFSPLKTTSLPRVVSFRCSLTTVPTMTSSGDVFYLATGNSEGWIRKVALSGEARSERIAWCPLSWRGVGDLTILASNEGTIVCLNKVAGISVVKMESGRQDDIQSP